MATTKTALVMVGMKAGRITIGLAGEPLTMESARRCVGRVMDLPTTLAHETARHTIQSVSENRVTGDITAWATRPGGSGGIHLSLVAV